MAGFPSKLVNFRLYLNGGNYAGLVPEIALPKLALKLVEYEAGGMLGPMDVDMGLDKLETDITWGGLLEVVLRDFGSPLHDISQLVFRGSFREEGTGTVRAMSITMRGRPTEVDLGTAKLASDTAHKTKYRLSYYRMVVDGVEWLEIDIMACIFRVFGIDRYAAIRAALGG